MENLVHPHFHVDPQTGAYLRSIDHLVFRPAGAAQPIDPIPPPRSREKA